MAAFELAGALASLPAPAALPDPLPDPPALPISYLSDLTARVYAATLTLDEQLALVAKLRRALLQKTEEREAALELLQALRNRRDLFYAAARDIETAIPQEVSDAVSTAPEAGAGSEQPEDALSDFAAAAVPPGWYPDPSSRHELRWFDMDWTSWVSDWGTVTEDPL